MDSSVYVEIIGNLPLFQRLQSPALDVPAGIFLKGNSHSGNKPLNQNSKRLYQQSFTRYYLFSYPSSLMRSGHHLNIDKVYFESL